MLEPAAMSFVAAISVSIGDPCDLLDVCAT